MTTLDLAKARAATRRAKTIVENNRTTMQNARAQEARLDRVLAESQIRSERYEQTLRRAGLLK